MKLRVKVCLPRLEQDICVVTEAIVTDSYVIPSSLQNCMKGSYAYLYANCAELYDRELASESSTLDPNVLPAGPKNLDFWPKLISLVVSVIEEDKSIYTQVLNQYVPLLYYHCIET